MHSPQNANTPTMQKKNYNCVTTLTDPRTHTDYTQSTRGESGTINVLCRFINEIPPPKQKHYYTCKHLKTHKTVCAFHFRFLCLENESDE